MQSLLIHPFLYACEYQEDEPKEPFASGGTLTIEQLVYGEGRAQSIIARLPEKDVIQTIGASFNPHATLPQVLFDSCKGFNVIRLISVGKETFNTEYFKHNNDAINQSMTTVDKNGFIIKLDPRVAALLNIAKERKQQVVHPVIPTSSPRSTTSNQKQVSSQIGSFESSVAGMKIVRNPNPTKITYGGTSCTIKGSNNPFQSPWEQSLQTILNENTQSLLGIREECEIIVHSITEKGDSISVFYDLKTDYREQLNGWNRAETRSSTIKKDVLEKFGWK